MLDSNIRRAVAMVVPFVTAMLLFGVVDGIFGVKIDENLFNTGVTPAIIFAILNLWVFYLAFKHQVP